MVCYVCYNWFVEESRTEQEKVHTSHPDIAEKTAENINTLFDELPKLLPDEIVSRLNTINSRINFPGDAFKVKDQRGMIEGIADDIIRYKRGSEFLESEVDAPWNSGKETAFRNRLEEIGIVSKEFGGKIPLKERFRRRASSVAFNIRRFSGDLGRELRLTMEEAGENAGKGWVGELSHERKLRERRQGKK